MKVYYLSLVFLCLFLCALTPVNASLLKSDAALTLLDSVSAIPLEDFLIYPELNDALSAETEGCFNSEILQFGSGADATVLLLQGYENFAPAFNLTNPVFVVYDITSGQLVEKSRLSALQGVGQDNAVISPNVNLPYVAYSPNQAVIPLPPNESAFISTIYTINVHGYSSAGVLNQVPSVVLPLSELSPLLYNQSIAYNGLAGVSDDGKYLVATFATGVGIEFFITGQELVILQVNSVNGVVTSLTAVASSSTAPTDIPNLYSFPQTLRMWVDPHVSSKYHLVVAENSWNFSYILGLTSQVSYYVFDSSVPSLTREASDWASQYIQGLGVDTVNGRVYSVSNQVVLGPSISHPLGGPSVPQFPTFPYDNAAVDKSSNLRAWNLNTRTGTLSYQGGIDLGQDGIQVRPSADGSLLAVSSAPVIVSEFFPTNLNPFAPLAYRYGPNVLTTYSVQGGTRFTLHQEASYGASPLSFCLAWDQYGETLAVGGQPTFSEGLGQKNVQLYAVSSQ